MHRQQTQDMKFDFTDAWILQSVFSSERPGQGADLGDIISYADYSNHAILSYSELTNSLHKLISIGLVLEIDNCVKTTDMYKAWWDKKFKSKKRIYALKAIEDTEKYLNKTFASVGSQKNQTTIQISSKVFQFAVDSYIARANKIPKDLK